MSSNKLSKKMSPEEETALMLRIKEQMKDGLQDKKRRDENHIDDIKNFARSQVDGRLYTLSNLKNPTEENKQEMNTKLLYISDQVKSRCNTYRLKTSDEISIMRMVREMLN